MITQRHFLYACFTLCLLAGAFAAMAEVGVGASVVGDVKLKPNQPLSIEKTVPLKNSDAAGRGGGKKTTRAGVTPAGEKGAGDQTQQIKKEAEKKIAQAVDANAYSNYKNKSFSSTPKAMLFVRKPKDGGGSEGEESSPPSSPILNTFIALGIVVGLIYLLRWVYSKMTGRKPVRADVGVLEVLSRVSVSPKNHVLLIKIANTVVVVGEGTQGLNTLTQITDDIQVAAILAKVKASEKGSISKNFQKMLGRFEDGYEPETSSGAESAEQGDYKPGGKHSQLSDLISKIRQSGRGK